MSPSTDQTQGRANPLLIASNPNIDMKCGLELEPLFYFQIQIQAQKSNGQISDPSWKSEKTKMVISIGQRPFFVLTHIHEIMCLHT